MTWIRLAFANLLLSPLTSAVNVLLMALGTASIVLLLLAGSQISDTMSRDARGIDMVLGATGSPIQLVLSAVYHADLPPGNIPLEEAERWADDPRVENAIPMSLGDSYRGFRIVGTTSDYAELYGARLDTGRFWDKPLEAVVGSAVTGTAGLGIESTFAGAHGMEEGGHSHEAKPYRVVGVLAPTGTVLDRLILTSLDSVWNLHAVEGPVAHPGRVGDQDQRDDDHDEDHEHGAEHNHEEDHDGESDHDADHEHDPDHDHGSEHDDEHEHDADHDHDSEHDDGHEHDEDREITAMLIQYASPMAAISLPREINGSGTLQAAAPAMEVARILKLIGIGLDGLTAFSWVLILTAALSVFAALYGSLRARRGDLAILRCLGATRGELLLALLLEGLLLSLIGVTLGFLVGHGTMEVLGGWLESERGIGLTGLTWLPQETLLLFSLFGVGVIAATIPALQAYRTDVARVLAEG